MRTFLALLMGFGIVFAVLFALSELDRRRVENTVPLAEYNAIQAVIDAEAGLDASPPKTATMFGSVFK